MYNDNNTGTTIFCTLLEVAVNYGMYKLGKHVAYKEIENKQMKEDIQSFKKRFNELGNQKY
jgi:hypothetical protein